jgi:hypothetical protein
MFVWVPDQGQRNWRKWSGGFYISMLDDACMGETRIVIGNFKRGHFSDLGVDGEIP